MMGMFALPFELRQEIIAQAVELRGLKRGLRLRLVNRQFSHDVKQVIFALHLPDSYLKLGRIPCKGIFWEQYLAYRIRTAHTLRFPIFKNIRDTAESICLEVGDRLSFGRRVETVDALSSLALQNDWQGCCLQITDEGPQWEPNELVALQHLMTAAAYFNLTSLIKRLTMSGIKFDVEDSVFGSPIAAASSQGHSNVVELILSTITDDRVKVVQRGLAIHGACRGGHLDTLDMLLQDRWGASVTRNSALNEYLKTGLSSPNFEVFLRTIEIMGLHQVAFLKQHLRHAFILAAREGRTEIVRHLLELGVGDNSDVVFDTRNPSQCATKQLRFVKLLIDQGAHLVFDNTNPLTFSTNYLRIVNLLIEKGIDLVQESRNCLSLAARAGSLDIVRLLLDRGADPNMGWPLPIIWAIQNENEAMFRLLVDRGALLGARSVTGIVMRLIGTEGMDSMLTLLLQEGIKIDRQLLIDYIRPSDQEEIRQMLARCEKELCTASITGAANSPSRLKSHTSIKPKEVYSINQKVSRLAAKLKEKPLYGLIVSSRPGSRKRM